MKILGENFFFLQRVGEFGRGDRSRSRGNRKNRKERKCWFSYGSEPINVCIC